MLIAGYVNVWTKLDSAKKKKKEEEGMDSDTNIVHQKPYVDIQSVQMCFQ